MAEGKKRKWYRWYFDIPLVTRILAGLILGGVLGIIVGPKIAVIQPLGELMVKLLKMIVLPLIFFAIVMGVGSMPISKTGRVAGKIMVYYFGSTLVAATIAIIIANIFKPGMGMQLAGAAASAGMEGGTITTPPVSEFLLNMIPDNVFAALSQGAFLQVLIFAAFVGFAIAALREHKDERVQDAVLAVYKVCEGGSEIMFAITKAVMEYTPIGIFALMAVTFAEQGVAVLGSAVTIIGLVYLGYAVHLVLTYGLSLSLIGHLNPLTFFAKAKDIMLTAFSTRSSSATLPTTLRCTEEKMGVSRSVCSFTLPLGSQINLDGEAIYQVIVVFTVAFASGIQLTIAQQILLAFIVTIGGTGTAGIAGSGPVIMLAVLNMVGLDVTAGTAGGAVYALVLGIDVILDMGRTTLNVTGDVCGTCIVAKSEGLMDLSKWKKEKKSAQA